MSSERVFTSPPDLLVTNFSILCFSTSFTYWLNQQPLHLNKCRITFQVMSLSTRSGQPDVLPEALPLGGFTPPLHFWATSNRTVVLTPSTSCFPSIPILLILRNASGSHGSREKKEIGAGSIWLWSIGPGSVFMPSRPALTQFYILHLTRECYYVCPFLWSDTLDNTLFRKPVQSVLSLGICSGLRMTAKSVTLSH